MNLFTFNPFSPDYVGPLFVEDTKGVNFDKSKLVWMPNPPKKWANFEDCGNFPCTSYNNTFQSYNRVSLAGLESSFKIASSDPGNSFTNC